MSTQSIVTLKEHIVERLRLKTSWGRLQLETIIQDEVDKLLIEEANNEQLSLIVPTYIDLLVEAGAPSAVIKNTPEYVKKAIEELQ